jgi:hypothetical protein
MPSWREIRAERDDGVLDQSRDRRGRVVVVVAVVVLLVAGAVALGGQPRPAASPVLRTSAVPLLAMPSSADDQRDVRSPTAVSIAPLLTAPPVSWQLFSGVAVPFSPTAGPRLMRPPVYAGYQRSQTGALIAAVQLGTRYLLTSGQGWREVVAQQVVPGTGRDAYVAARSRVQLDDPSGSYGQVAGFRVLAYTPDVAVLQLVSRFPLTGHLQVTTTTLAWVGGDWRLVLQPDGGSSPTAQAASGLDGFVAWGGF